MIAKNKQRASICGFQLSAFDLLTLVVRKLWEIIEELINKMTTENIEILFIFSSYESK